MPYQENTRHISQSKLYYLAEEFGRWYPSAASFKVTVTEFRGYSNTCQRGIAEETGYLTAVFECDGQSHCIAAQTPRELYNLVAEWCAREYPHYYLKAQEGDGLIRMTCEMKSWKKRYGRRRIDG